MALPLLCARPWEVGRGISRRSQALSTNLETCRAPSAAPLAMPRVSLGLGE